MPTLCASQTLAFYADSHAVLTVPVCISYHVFYFLFQALSPRKQCFYLFTTCCSLLVFHGFLSTCLCGSLDSEKVRTFPLTHHSPTHKSPTRLVTCFRFAVWHISHHIRCDVLLPDPGISWGPQCCLWYSPDKCCPHSYTGMVWSLSFKCDWNCLNTNVLSGGWKEFYPLHYFW